MRSYSLRGPGRLVAQGKSTNSVPRFESMAPRQVFTYSLRHQHTLGEAQSQQGKVSARLGGG